MIYFNFSHIGYSHLESHKPCQDSSSSTQIDGKIIITTCDGHGGDLYIRSKMGSRFASLAILKAFSEIESVNEVNLDSLKLKILNNWNNFVDEDLVKHPFSPEELTALKEKDQIILNSKPVKAYGTTLIGAMYIDGKFLLVQLGDGETILLKDSKIYPCFIDESDDTPANITNSMCEDDAYSHIKSLLVDANDYDGVFLCTDGVINAYGGYDNFSSSFILPLLKETLKDHSFNKGEDYISRLGNELGTGDDVSISLIYNDNLSIEPETIESKVDEKEITDESEDMSEVQKEETNNGNDK
jgi:serine/threonine protein phosphatase PrpC